MIPGRGPRNQYQHHMKSTARGTPEHVVWSAIATTYDVRYIASIAESIWMTFPRGDRLHIGDLTLSCDPSTCHADYLDWFGRYSHPVLVCGTVSRPERPLDRTCGDAWMSRAIRVAHPFLTHRDMIRGEQPVRPGSDQRPDRSGPVWSKTGFYLKI